MGEAKSFYTFWVEYLHQHELLATRLWHFVGTSAALVSALLALITWHWVYLVVAFVVSYGCSWMGHFFVEKNRPVSFRHPIWSLRADLLLFQMMLTRGLTESINTFKLL
ncbi:MAG: DUF962 domain-containing protein [Firmicutes bacterium]|nr:DUF962 domain-containing protein [Bacillota bacterium]